VDKDKKEKSSLGNDSELNREKNKVTGVRTSDQLPERKSSGEVAGNQKHQKQGEKNAAA
jgi:hypothetical protein